MHPPTDFSNNTTDDLQESARSFSQPLIALSAGTLVGILGGLIGLGGAEFRLPLLVSWFGLPILLSILVNLLISLVTVTFSLLFRLPIQGGLLWLTHWRVVVNLLLGSLLGSALGARMASNTTTRRLKGIIAALLVLLGALLISHEWLFAQQPLRLNPLLRSISGIVAGLLIGIVSSLLGVAGGELLIPTLTLLFAVEIKLAGSLSLLVSLPTISMGLWRYSRHAIFAQLRSQTRLVIWMALGSILGAYLGSRWLPYVSSTLLQIFLGCILFLSAYRIWRSHPS
ncbi:MAG: sulfite exporter TauE/SafE family protein [Anaerolineales bacterium]|nr:sulfite exporter TauE/SafE family protein [Anaerolineales bacterium]MCS7248102.1 sulfite exporter TauE/SafE family protein [Anaerolineales bacterium]MDW8161914.1 sulfite exporter TauE/SafE family protein [Anaerolineales bacterium]MDW8447921.1 sulfite exporter TauE/SafE family protein [Anaerolineales bacterium]